MIVNDAKWRTKCPSRLLCFCPKGHHWSVSFYFSARQQPLWRVSFWKAATNSSKWIKLFWCRTFVEPPLQTIYLPKMNRKNSDYYSRPQWFTASDEQNIFETHKWVFNQCKPIFHHKSKSLYMSWIEYSRTTLKTVLIYSFTPSKNHHRLGMPASWVCPTPAAPWATWRDARGVLGWRGGKLSPRYGNFRGKTWQHDVLNIFKPCIPISLCFFLTMT